MRNKWSHSVFAFFTITLICLPVLMVNFKPVSAASNFNDNFSDNSAGNWTPQLGSWNVTNGQYCVSVGIIENGISTVKGINLADCTIETQVQFTDSVGFRAGIIFRYIDSKHYYSFELSNEYDTLDMIKYTPQDPNYGDGSGLAQLKPFPIQSGKVYQLKVVVTGNLFRCYVDGQEVLNGTDNEYSSGTVGLRARRADACFDNFKVYGATQPLPQTPAPTQSFTPSNPSVGTYTDDFSSDSGYWHYLGDAYRDQTNQYLVLTTSGYEHVGVALFNFPVQSSFTANFRYKAGGGDWHGDGLTLFFYKKDYPTTIDHVYSGNHLGFNSYSPIPGYGVEFDGWQNIPWDFAQVTGADKNVQGDPSDSHIALVQDFTGNHLVSVNDTRIEDNNWHQASIEVQTSSVRVFVDQALVLQWNGAIDRTYSGFGLSGATGGGASNWHIIDDFSITTQELKKPALTVSCVSQVTEHNFNVEINGGLTFDGTAISGAPIRLSYSVNDGDSWQDLTTVHSDSDGSFSALWMLQVTGDYLLKAVYNGSERYLSTNKIVNFAIAPSEQQKSVFSLNSNSTITELAFNSTTKELRFGVAGETGTSGYVEVYIPKSLLSDAAAMKVYLDNTSTSYTTKEQGDCWQLYFTYHHSRHIVTIQLNAAQAITLPPIVIAAIIGSIVAAGIGIVYAEYRLYYKNKSTPKTQL